VRWQVLWASGELLWYSQRDDWGNLYLYDLASGRLKNRVTPSAAGPVTQIVRLDEVCLTDTSSLATHVLIQVY